MTKVIKNESLSLGAYEIGTGLLGAPMFLVDLGFDNFYSVAAGGGKITQATMPAVSVSTQLYGKYSTNKKGMISVSLLGYPIYKPLKAGNFLPGIKPNVKLSMTLDSNMITGVATYSYLNQAGDWITVKNAPVNKKEVPAKPIDILLVVDTAATLATRTLEDNIYVISTQGSSTINCTDGQELIWRTVAVAPSGDVSISSFGGDLISEEICVPRKQGTTNTYWEGTIDSQGTTGVVDYSINFSIEGQSFSYSTSLNIK